MAKKKSVPKKAEQPAQKRYFKDIKRKKHEAGWVSLIKIGCAAFFLFVVLAFGFGYGSVLPVTTILFSGLEVGLMVIMLVIFIVGLITVSENTVSEMRKK